MTTSTQRVVRKLLFPATSPNPERPAPRAVDGVTVFLRLRLRDGVSVDKVNQAVESLLAAASQRRADLNASAAYLYSDATHGGVELVPFVLTRTHRALALISTVAGVPTPPKFESTLKVAPTVLLEFQFAAPLEFSQREVVYEIQEAVKALAADISINECDRRYVVLDSRASRQDAVFLTVATRKPWNRTLDDAQRYWINEHAALVYDNRNRTNMSGYVQVHTTQDPASPFDNRFSGVATIEFDQLRDYVLQGFRPTSMAFNSTLVFDEMNLTVDSELYLFTRSTLFTDSE